MAQEIGEEISPNPLLLFCFESVAVCDKTTFLSYAFDKLNVTYWHEEAKDEKERVNGMFAVLFQEVLKKRQNKINLINRKNE